MASLKEAHRSAALAFSPNASYLAAGTVAGAIDMSFSTTSTLEVFKLDFSSSSHELPLAGQAVNALERFHRLSWNAFAFGSPEQEKFPHGLIAGGLADGSIALWDAQQILRGRPESAQLAKETKHHGAVKGLAFNQLSPNLLASGGADGDIIIWDVANPRKPTAFPPLKSRGPSQGAGSEIANIAWNRKVQHILASCTVGGSVTVWDLKKQQPVLNIRDSSGRLRRCSSMQWHPTLSTLLMVACEDDMSPVIQLWDLRSAAAMTPARELLGHNKGVLAMSWSGHDAGLLLSSAKDHRTVLWDVVSGEVLGEVPAGDSWDFDVLWSPNNPGVFATSSYGTGEGSSGKLRVCSLASFGASPTTETVNDDFSMTSAPAGPATPLKRAPAWLKRPAGVAFGFGNRLVSFKNISRQGQAGEHVDAGIVTLSHVATENDLIGRSEAFEQAMNENALAQFCDYKVANSDGDDQETWLYLRILFEADPKRHLLENLGFHDALPPEPLAEPSTLSSVDAAAQSLEDVHLHNASLAGGDGFGDGLSPHGEDNGDFFEQQDDGDFFDNLQPSAAPTPEKPRSEQAEPPSPAVIRGLQEEAGESEATIERALYIGNYTAAVDACIKANRMADALLIADLAGRDELMRVQQIYMKKQPSPYMRVVKAIQGNDFVRLVKERPLDQWKETLAILCSHSNLDEFQGLCDALARRLSGGGLTHAATLCWICAAKVDQALHVWAKELLGKQASVSELQELMERAVVLTQGGGQPQASPALGDLVAQYSTILASQGRMHLAWDYLHMVADNGNVALLELRERIYNTGSADIPQDAPPPVLPYQQESVVPQAPPAASSGYNGGPGSVGGNSYAASSYDPYAQSQHAYAAAAMQPAAPSSPYRQHAGGFGGGGGFGSAMAVSNPYASSAAPVPGRSPVAQRPAQGTQQWNQQPQAPPAQPQWASQQPPAPSQGGWPQQSHQQQSGYASQQHDQAGLFPPAPAYAGMSQGQGAAGGYPSHGTPQVFIPQAPAASSAGPPPPPSHSNKAYQTPQFIPQTSPKAAPAAHFNPPQQFMPQQAPGSGGFPGMGHPQQSQAPAAPSKPAAPPAPTGPPATVNISNVDTSKVSPQMQAPNKKREMDDNSKKMGQLFWKLNAGDVSDGVVQKLMQLKQALDQGDLNKASSVQVSLTTSDWDECSSWLTALKRLIKARQMLG
ncbi:hypothetical protein WJX79_004520 [Trebouxia sp. C0005]